MYMSKWTSQASLPVSFFRSLLTNVQTIPLNGHSFSSFSPTCIKMWSFSGQHTKVQQDSTNQGGMQSGDTIEAAGVWRAAEFKEVCQVSGFQTLLCSLQILISTSVNRLYEYRCSFWVTRTTLHNIHKGIVQHLRECTLSISPSTLISLLVIYSTLSFVCLFLCVYSAKCQAIFFNWIG